MLYLSFFYIYKITKLRTKKSENKRLKKKKIKGKQRENNNRKDYKGISIKFKLKYLCMGKLKKKEKCSYIFGARKLYELKR